MFPPSYFPTGVGSFSVENGTLKFRATDGTIYRVVTTPDWDTGCVPGLQLWYRADALTNLAEGAPVASWPDSSGNGRAATQAVAANRPTYAAAGLNGRPAVRFNGVSSFLGLAASPLAPGRARTVFVVGRDDGGVGGALLTFRGAAPVHALALLWTGSALSIYSDVVAAADGATIGDQRALIRAPFLAEFAAAGAGSKIRCWLNGTAQAVTQPGAVGLDDGADGLRIGLREGAMGQPWNGMIAEVLVYDSALSAADRQRAERYLAGKYAIALPTA